MIIDEISLPAALRTASQVRLSDEVEDVVEDNDDVFVYENIVYRVIATPPSERDLSANYSDVYMRYVCATDSVKHKMIGNETRAHCAVQKALSLLNDTECSLHATTLLQTLVDYGGYRVQVICPVFLEETKTLVYGNFSGQDIFVNVPIEDDSGLTESPCVQLLIKVAEKLGIETNVVDAISCQSPMQVMHGEEFYKSQELILSPDIQLHIGFDNRFYMMNFKNLLPPDAPGSDTNDVLTKHFRPEYLTKHPRPLCPMAFTANFESNLSDIRGDAPNEDLENDDHNESFNANTATENDLEFDLTGGGGKPQVSLECIIIVIDFYT